MDEEVLELKAVVKGLVQGVFFRRTVKEHASDLSLSGYAKNLPNGNVEICLQGKKSSLEAFLKRVQQNPGNGRIDDLSYSFSSIEKHLHGFQIL